MRTSKDSTQDKVHLMNFDCVAKIKYLSKIGPKFLRLASHHNAKTSNLKIASNNSI